MLYYPYFPNFPQVMNKTLYDYCKRTTQESIRKLTEKHNLEKNKIKFKNPLDENDDSGKPEFNFYSFLTFLSISTIGFLIYKRLK
jgi:hypothetical protein